MRMSFTLAGALVLLVVVPLGLTLLGSPYAGRLAQLLVLTLVLTSSLNLLTGTAGLLSLDTVVWYGLGAYGGAILSTRYGWSIGMELLVVGVGAAVLGFGLALALVRLVSVFFAVATMGLAISFFTTVLNWGDLTQGPMGIKNIPALRPFGDAVSPWMGNYLLAAGFAVVALAIVHRVSHSFYGNVVRGVREDEEAAQALGLRPRRIKAQVYALHAVLMALTGVLYAHSNRFIGPDNFVLLESALVLTAIVVGGLGSLVGSVIGAALVVLLPEALRELGSLRSLAFGLVLFLSIMFLPRGLFGEARSLALVRRWFNTNAWHRPGAEK